MNELIERVEAEVDAGWDAELAFLRDLVATPSTLHHEAAAQARVMDELRGLGLEPEAQAIDKEAIRALPGYSPVDWGYEARPNVSAGWRGRGGGRSLVLNGHIDVVPVTPERLWTHDPWGAEIVGGRTDGRLYGRGAADMKSGIAAMVYAVAAIRRAGIALRGDVTIQSVIEEECTGNGTLAALEAARAAGGRDGAVADAAIIPEPFDQSVLAAQIGVLWARVTVIGAGAHVLGADRAVNAIDKAAVLMEGIKAMEAAANAAPRQSAFAGVPHPLNYNVGVVRGGDWPSSVPSECVLEVRFSAYPGADLEEAQRGFEAGVQAVAARDPWLREHPPGVEFYGFRAEGCEVDQGAGVVDGLRRAHRRVMGTEAEPYVSTATTDVRFFSLYHGIPATCYGPVGGALHAPDEWVDLRSVRNVTRVLALTALEWCGAAG